MPATRLPLRQLSQSGATTNQVPQWNGSAWVPATVSAGGGTTVGVRQVTLDFGPVPVYAKGFVFAATATVGQRVLMTAAGESDEAEMDGFACAARVSGANEVTAYVVATPGPVSGTRVFNLIVGSNADLLE